MLYSMRWLREFTPVPHLPAREMRDAITTHIAEIEAIEDDTPRFSGVVVGKILEIQKHPQADRLNCTVTTTDGKNRLRIVCGAANIAVGQIIPVALPDARVLDRKTGETFTIEKTILRGEPSEGMLCSAEELGIPPQEDGIHQLPADTPLGTPFERLLSEDVRFDIENKSLTHRPDLWGHHGMARELSTLFQTPLLIPEPKTLNAPAGIPVKLDAATGTRCYHAVTVSGVAATPSPEPLRTRLEQLGVRSVNALVDVTNLVMLETGQPLHAFDAAQVTTLRVRLAKAGESMVSFDGSTLTLDPQDVVIAGTKDVLALAGVVGGPHSGVSDTTTSIVLEAASFDPVRIRRTSARHAARTDAAVRFEKDVDPALTATAAARAVELLREIFPDASVTGLTEVVKSPRKPLKIKLRIAHVHAMIGDVVPRADIMRILESLGCSVSGRADTLTVTVPTFRGGRDLDSPEDLIEEIARFHGYNALPAAQPAMPLTVLEPIAAARAALLQDLVTRCAYQLAAIELQTYPFQSPETLRRWGETPETHWRALNPQSGDASHLRASLLPGMVEAAIENLRRRMELGRDSLRFFEIGQVFHREPGELSTNLADNERLPHQPQRLGLVEVVAEGSLTRLQAALNALIIGLGLPAPRYTRDRAAPAALHPGRTALVSVDGHDLGVVGELHPRARRLLDGQSVAFAELDVATLVRLRTLHPRAVTPPPAFPGATRDVSALFAEETTMGTVQDALTTTAHVIEVFRGAALPEGTKSVTVRLHLRAVDRTLTDADLTAAVRGVEDALRQLGGTIR